MLFDDAILIGKAAKHRPVQDDVQIVLKNFEAEEIGGKFLIAEIDGIKVPFLVESRTDKGGSMFAKLKECALHQQGYSAVVGCNIYCRRGDLVEAAQSSAHPFRPLIGCNVCDTGNGGKIGKIIAIDDTTANTVMTVSDGEREILIPLAEDFIDHLDKKGGTLYLRLPDGLLDIYGAENTKAQEADE